MTELWQMWFCVIVMALIGVFCICACIFNWDWFFNNRKAQTLVKLFGRNGTRIFYAILGAVIIVLSIVCMVTQFFQ